MIRSMFTETVSKNKDVLIVRTDPQDEYQKVLIVRRGENITIGKLPGLSFSVDEILGPPAL